MTVLDRVLRSGQETAFVLLSGVCDWECACVCVCVCACACVCAHTRVCVHVCKTYHKIYLMALFCDWFLPYF